METISFRFFFRHNLNIHFPFWKIPTLNCLKQVTLGRLSILPHYFCCCFICQIFDSLLSNKMKFHPMPYILFVDKTIGMATETMHMAVPSWNTAVAHYNSYLV